MLIKEVKIGYLPLFIRYYFIQLWKRLISVWCCRFRVHKNQSIEEYLTDCDVLCCRLLLVWGSRTWRVSVSRSASVTAHCLISSRTTTGPSRGASWRTRTLPASHPPSSSSTPWEAVRVSLIQLSRLLKQVGNWVDCKARHYFSVPPTLGKYKERNVAWKKFLLVRCIKTNSELI